MTRVCFQLLVKPELLDEYLARHTAVWPKMLAAARSAAAGPRPATNPSPEEGIAS